MKNSTLILLLNHKIFIFLLSILFLGSSFSGKAQSAQMDSSATKFSHQLGIAAGFTTAYGLSYKLGVKNFYFQTTFTPYKTEYSTRLASGTSVLYVFDKFSRTNLLFYCSNALYLKVYKDFDIQTKRYFRYSYLTINTGLGFGFERKLSKNFRFTTMFGYAGYDSFKRINLTGEVGLFFKF